MLPHRPVQEIEVVEEERRWLIEGLWADQAVGIVGGEPKCCKSFLALDAAVSVASGAPCLRRFPVRRTGRVLLFAAEDPLPVVRERLQGIARAAAVPFEDLDIRVITVASLRLDIEDDRKELRETVEALQPVLLVLDPFVRLHRVDENAAADVAPLLDSLRTLQRRFQTAVLLVHHARKGAAATRAGQALRGSSDLHAWGDSNLYLRRRGDTLRLTIEHRAAPAVPDLALELRTSGDAVALHAVEPPIPSGRPPDPASPPLPAPAPPPAQRILQTLAAAPTPLTLRELRGACRLKTATLCHSLDELSAAGRVVRAPGGYRLAAP